MDSKLEARAQNLSQDWTAKLDSSRHFSITETLNMLTKDESFDLDDAVTIIERARTLAYGRMHDPQTKQQ